MNTPVINVSSGEPSGRWKIWAKWFALMALPLIVALVIASTQLGRDYPFLIFVVLPVLLYRFRLAEQRLELLIEQHVVQVTLFMDIRNRVWIDWSSQHSHGRTHIGNWPRVPIWLDHEIELGGRRYNLRIYAKHFPGGYMVSNAGRGFHMKVIDNRFCF